MPTAFDEAAPPYPPTGHAGLSKHVLLIEDDEEAAVYTAEKLQEHGWRVRMTGDGLAGLEACRHGTFNVIIVDRMLPSLDGLSLVAQLRAEGVQTPVLFVTAMGAVSDRVVGLEAGGDDYLVKPYSFAELHARLNALTRRHTRPAPDETMLRCRGVTMDRLRRSVLVGDKSVELLPLEFKLLEFFLLHVGEIITRSMLLQEIWGFRFDPQTNIVETHISRLRSKVDRDGEPPLIRTVRGAGYVVGEQ